MYDHWFKYCLFIYHFWISVNNSQNLCILMFKNKEILNSGNMVRKRFNDLVI